MKRSNLAIMMNAFVMPGSGHILIGEKLKGYAISSITLFLLLAPLVRYTMMVINSLDALSRASQGFPANLNAMSDAWAQSKGFILYCVLGIAAMWLYGILDLALRRQNTRT